MGSIESSMVMPFPALDEEQAELLRGVTDSVGQLMHSHEEDFARWDKAGEMPPEFIQELREFGLFGLVIPEQYGGLGFGSGAYSRTLQELARYDASVAVTVGAHSSIGMRGLLLFGNDEQKSRYFPKLVSGELIAAFCLTEPGAGSDAASIKTHAELDGDAWVLSGSKLWITNGGIADFYTVFAKTSSEGRGKITAFLVTKDMGDITIGPHEDKLGIRASSTTTVTFDNVRVPVDNVLGEVNKGFKIAMTILNSGRSGLGGGSIGAMKRLIERASKQANERKQFGKAIAEYGLIKEKLGQMVVDCYATEAVVTMVAGLSDQGYEDYAVEAAISKVFATECLWRTADEALQIAAGNGYMMEYPYQRILRDSRINRIFEGTNEVLRLFIALSAMGGVGAQLKELQASLQGVFNDPIKGFGVLSEYALKRGKLAARIRGEEGSLSGVAAELKREAEIFETGVQNLAGAVDRVLRKHGKGIIGKQLASKRLADIMIDLFALVAVLSRVTRSVQEKGATDAARELEIARVFAHQVRARQKTTLAEIDDNQDDALKSLAEHTSRMERFDWDTL